MKPFSFSLSLAALSLSAILFLPGCVTPKEEPTSILSEDEEIASRKQVYGNWLRPSVTEEDKAFFYKPWWKSRN